MAQTMLQKRGLKVDLPVLNEGEIGLCTDENEVFIGNNGNVMFATAHETTQTYYIPSDFADLQTAINALSIIKNKQATKIELVFEYDHAITTPLILEDGDYSNFIIKSVGSVVAIASSFVGDLFTFNNCRAPIIDVLVNGGAIVGNGIILNYCGTLKVNPGKGVTHCMYNNLRVDSSIAYVKNSVFTYGSQAGDSANGWSGILSWGGRIFAQGADASFSKTYGIQAAHGGIVSFRDGIANNCGRYNIRATNLGILDARYAQASGTARFGVYAFGASKINAREALIDNCTEFGVIAIGASIVDCRAAQINGNEVGVLSSAGSTVNVGSAHVNNSTFRGLHAERTGTIDAWYCEVLNTGTTLSHHGVFCENVSTISVSNATVKGSGGDDLRIDTGGVIGARNCTTTNGIGSPNINDTDADMGSFNSLVGSRGIIWT